MRTEWYKNQNDVILVKVDHGGVAVWLTTEEVSRLWNEAMSHDEKLAKHMECNAILKHELKEI